jgi:hypothetical protein
MTKEDRENVVEIEKKIKTQEELEKKNEETLEKIDLETNKLQELKLKFKDASLEEKITINEKIAVIEKNIEDINKDLNIEINKKGIIIKNADFLNDFKQESILTELTKNNDWYRDNNEQFTETVTILTNISKQFPQNEKIKKLITILKD